MFVPIYNKKSALEVITLEYEWRCIQDICFCEESQRIASAISHFHFIKDFEMQIEGGLAVEFAFDVRFSFLDDIDMTFETQDRGIVANYLGDDCRSLIMPAVLLSIPPLVYAARPDRIFRVAKGSGLPEKAYLKHLLITNFLEDLGFMVAERGWDHHHRPFWIMERQA